MRRAQLRRPFAVSIVAVTIGAGALTARADCSRPVTEWVRQEALPLATVDPNVALDDLAPLRQSIGDVSVVGLGESVHGASEELTLKHRMLRFLIEELGFDSVAWEEDWTTGLKIDRYIRTGDGDLDAIVSEMSPQWQSREVADVVEWLRTYNSGRADKVRFFGVEYYFTRRPAYDALEAYVADVAPQRLAALRHHLDVIRPFTADKFAYVEWYRSVSDKRPYIRRAHAVQTLIRSIRGVQPQRRRQVALHHARQIVSFYEHYDLNVDDSNVYREAHAARNLRWWQELTGDEVAYWAASAHTANAPRLRIVQPGSPDFRFPSVGSYLRRWYGSRYLSVGFTFDHGRVSLGPDGTADMPPPNPDWFEQPFGPVGIDQFASICTAASHARSTDGSTPGS